MLISQDPRQAEKVAIYYRHYISYDENDGTINVKILMSGSLVSP